MSPFPDGDDLAVNIAVFAVFVNPFGWHYLVILENCYLIDNICICRVVLWLLTFGAEVAAAVSDGNTLDKCAANRAWLTAAVSCTEVVMRSAQPTVRPFIGINAGALTVNA